MRRLVWVLQTYYRLKVWQLVVVVSLVIGKRHQLPSPFKPRKTRRWARHKATFKPPSHRVGSKNRYNSKYQTSQLRSLTQTRCTGSKARTWTIRCTAIMISMPVSMTLALVASPLVYRIRIRRIKEWREVLWSPMIAKGNVVVWSLCQ